MGSRYASVTVWISSKPWCNQKKAIFVLEDKDVPIMDGGYIANAIRGPTFVLWLFYDTTLPVNTSQQCRRREVEGTKDMPIRAQRLKVVVTRLCLFIRIGSVIIVDDSTIISQYEKTDLDEKLAMQYVNIREDCDG
jgi:hypothetical protein